MSRPGGTRFLSWYRAVPLFIVAVLGIIAAVYSYAPAALFKTIYPLKYEQEIRQSASRHGVDPYLVAAVIRTESSWNSTARSSRGAQGLMQLMPETATEMEQRGLVSASYSANSLDDPATNIEFGCAYLAYLLSYFNGATDRAIAAYNAGMGNVDDWSQQGTALHNAITFPETQAYLIRVNNAYERYKQIYPTAFAG